MLTQEQRATMSAMWIGRWKGWQSYGLSMAEDQCSPRAARSSGHQQIRRLATAVSPGGDVRPGCRRWALREANIAFVHEVA